MESNFGNSEMRTLSGDLSALIFGSTSEGPVEETAALAHVLEASDVVAYSM